MAELDVLDFEGQERLSRSFSDGVKFTCSDHQLARETLLMKTTSMTLQPPVNHSDGIKIQKALRVMQKFRTSGHIQGPNLPSAGYPATSVFTPVRDLPGHAGGGQVMYFGEDDLNVVTCLPEGVGAWFCFAAVIRLSIDVVEFYDNSRATRNACPYRQFHRLASIQRMWIRSEAWNATTIPDVSEYR